MDPTTPSPDEDPPEVRRPPSPEAMADEFELRTGRSQTWPDDLRHQLERWTLLKAIEAAAAPADGVPPAPRTLERLSACAGRLKPRFDARTADLCARMAEIESQPSRTHLTERISASYADALRLACYRRLWAAGGAAVFKAPPPRQPDAAALRAAADVHLDEVPDADAPSRRSARRAGRIVLALGCAASLARCAAAALFRHGTWHFDPVPEAPLEIALYAGLHGAAFAAGTLGLSALESLYTRRVIEPREQAVIAAAREKAQGEFAEARLAVQAEYARKREAWVRACADERGGACSAYANAFPALSASVAEMRTAWMTGLDAVRALGSRLAAATRSRAEFDSDDFASVEKEICARINSVVHYFDPKADSLGLVGLGPSKPLPEPPPPPAALPRLKVRVTRRSHTPASSVGSSLQIAVGLALAASAIPTALGFREPAWLASASIPERWLKSSPAPAQPVSGSPAAASAAAASAAAGLSVPKSGPAPEDTGPVSDPPRVSSIALLARELTRRGLKPTLYEDLHNELFRGASSGFYADVFGEAMSQVGLTGGNGGTGSISGTYHDAYTRYRNFIAGWTVARFAQDCGYAETPDPAEIDNALYDVASELSGAGLRLMHLEGTRDALDWTIRCVPVEGESGSRVTGKAYLRALHGGTSDDAAEALRALLVDQARHGALPTFERDCFVTDPGSILRLYNDADVAHSPYYKR